MRAIFCCILASAFAAFASRLACSLAAWASALRCARFARRPFGGFGAVASIVGRWAVSGDDELPAVHALQDATTLTPRNPDAVPAGLALPDPGVPESALFLEKLRVWSQQFPPAPRDRPLQASLASTGIAVVGDSPYASIALSDAARLVGDLEAAQQSLHSFLTHGSSPEVNGWKLTFHAFDYNLDYFEIGALDDDRFKIIDPEVRIPERAAAALGGLWGNHPYEAAYIVSYVDDHGDQLAGERTYTLRLDPEPRARTPITPH